MYQIHTDAQNGVMYVTISSQLCLAQLVECLDAIHEARREFHSSYSVLVELGKGLNFVEAAAGKLDLTIGYGSFKKLQKAVIVYPQHDETSRKTAERVRHFYEGCKVTALVKDDIADAKRSLGLLWR